MTEPTAAIQLGFLKVPTLALGITGSVAVHAAVVVALTTVWIEDPLALPSEADSAFAKGQPIQVTLSAQEQRPIEWSEAIVERQAPTIEAQDHLEIQHTRSSRQEVLLSEKAIIATSFVSLAVEPNPRPKSMSEVMTQPAPTVKPLEIEAPPKPPVVDLPTPPLPVCTTEDVLNPLLPPMPQQPQGVAQGIETRHLPEPIYPSRSIRLGQEGTVLVEVQVLANGQIGTVRMHESSGHHLLDEAALKAARKGRFKPAMLDGIALESTVILPFEFHLE